MEEPGMKVQGPRVSRLELYVVGAVVAAHLAVNVAHGAAHTALQIDAPPGWMPFILIVTFAAPVLGFGILLLRPLTGALIVAASMLASLMFGVAFHFVIDSPDHWDHVGDGLRATSFRATAALLVITQIVAIGAVAMLRRRHALRSDDAGFDARSSST
jgi:hypothetical protein